MEGSTLGISKSQNKKFIRDITEMICTDMQPFSMVENKCFEEMINNYLPDYKLQCRTIISRTYIHAEIVLRSRNENKK